MRAALAQNLMEEFADDTGITGKKGPRRYLWTDAFAVCNFLGLFQQTGDERYLQFARELVDQVHHILGRHRDDDPRCGWISGLSEETGEQHPTRGGLRIGKTLNERAPHEHPDSRLEWDRDGQYFHYLTKWIHALYRVGRVTGDGRYQHWAAELAATAHASFTREISPGGPKRMVWKKSIDLSRPLVSSMGQHDPLDGLITCLELQTAEGFEVEGETDLTAAIADMAEMSAQSHWLTEDPLGIGGLLDGATRLAQMIVERGVEYLKLLHRLLTEAELGLRCFSRSFVPGRPAEQRLAFRELGLSIGIQGVQMIGHVLTRDLEVDVLINSLLPYLRIGKQIESFWTDPAHRLNSTWTDHRGINTVMLATSLAPEGYLRL